MDADRIARVVVKGPVGEPRRVASGYRVSTTSVLSAAHVFVGVPSDAVEISLDVGGEGEWSPRVVDLWSDQRSGTDLAVVTISSRRGEEIDPVQLGWVSRERDAVVSFTVAGFPRWKLRPDASGSVRDLLVAQGRIAALSNRRTGTLDLELDRPPGEDPDRSHSPWEGMSGAAVIVDARVVGVVAEHHRREGLAHLSARPLSDAFKMLSVEQLEQMCALLGIPTVLEELVDVVPLPLLPAALERATAVARSLKGNEPIGRESELAALTRFCAGRDSYLRVEGEPWAGKTALLAWFAGHPPLGTMVVSHFISRTDPQRSDSDAFLQTLNDQLRTVIAAPQDPTADPKAEYLRLLDAAAETCHRQQQPLVLVIDGLDEDTSEQRGKIPVGALLPQYPPEGLRIVVASRLYPHLPLTVPGNHPVRVCPCLRLKQSAEARELKGFAEAELSAEANEPVAEEILGCISASGGGLTAADVAKLIGKRRLDIERLVHERLGRSLSCSLQGGKECGYLFAHPTLLATAAALFEDEISDYQKKIESWAASYAQAEWPEDTPHYLVSSYPHLLEDRGDALGATRLAIDPARQELLYRRTHADGEALAQIRAAHRIWCASGAPDLAAVASLTGHRLRLEIRNSVIPALLPSVWAALGQVDRAEQASRSIGDPHQQAWALREVARALAETDPDRAETIAASIGKSDLKAEALTEVAAAVADTDLHRSRRLADAVQLIAPSSEVRIKLAKALALADPELAETIARSMDSPDGQADALGEVARALVATHPDRANQLASDAEGIARSVQGHWQAWALAKVVRALGSINPDRAETIAWSIKDPDRRAEALGNFSEAIAPSDPDRAETIARSIEDPDRQAKALAHISAVVAATDTDRARRLAEAAEEGARSIDAWHSWALLDVARTLAATDPERAEVIARTIAGPLRASTLATFAGTLAATAPDRAEGIVRSIGPASQAEGLAEVARALAASDAEGARRLADTAEAVARSIGDPELDATSLARVARALASSDPERALALAEGAEVAIRRIDPSGRDWRLIEVAQAFSALDPDRAEAIAESIADPDAKALALAGLAESYAGSDAGRARRLAIAAERVEWAPGEIGDSILANIAAAFSATDPNHAEEIAGSIVDADAQARAKTTVAGAVAPSNPDRAETIAQSIVELDLKAEALAEVAGAIAGSDPERAQRLLEVAEETAQSISHPARQAGALTRVAAAVASSNPKRARDLIEAAERAARSISFSDSQDWALAEVAGAAVSTARDLAEHVVCEGLLSGEWTSFLGPLHRLNAGAVAALADAFTSEHQG